VSETAQIHMILIYSKEEASRRKCDLSQIHKCAKHSWLLAVVAVTTAVDTHAPSFNLELHSVFMPLDQIYTALPASPAGKNIYFYQAYCR